MRSSTTKSRSILSLPFRFSATRVEQPASDIFDLTICMRAVAPPWYSLVSILMSSPFSKSSPSLYQENFGGGSPLHLMCQMADRFTLTDLDPAAPWSMEGLKFLCLHRCGFVSQLGHDSPALLTAMTLNWYHLPSLKPGILASSSSMVQEQLLSSVTKASNQPPNLSFFWTT